MIIPEEGIGWEMQVVAIMKGTKNLETRNGSLIGHLVTG